jgi:hypothetical protein
VGADRRHRALHGAAEAARRRGRAVLRGCKTMGLWCGKLAFGDIWAAPDGCASVVGVMRQRSAADLTR